MRKALDDWARQAFGDNRLAAVDSAAPSPQTGTWPSATLKARRWTKSWSRPDAPTVGERLRAAREEKGLSLEDIAAQTRIPLRHLESIETADWDKLPGADLHDRLRQELRRRGRPRPHRNRRPAARGNGRPALRRPRQAEVFEAADPARTMPKWLVFGAIVAVIVLIVADELAQPPLARADREPTARGCAAAPAPATAAPRRAAAPAPPPAQGPVVLDRDRAGLAPGHAMQGKTLFSGHACSRARPLRCPPTATAPVLKTGKPEALRITVGNAVAPPVGPAGQVTSNVSLLAGRPVWRRRAPAAPPRRSRPAQRRLAPGAPADAGLNSANRDSSAGKPRRGTVDVRHRSVGNIREIMRLITALAASAAIALAAVRRAWRSASRRHARAAHRPARKAGAAGPAPGLPEGPAGRHRRLLRRSGGDPVLGRDARPAARRARAADGRPAPPVGRERQPRCSRSRADLAQLRADQEQRISALEQRHERGASAAPVGAPGGPDAEPTPPPPSPSRRTPRPRGRADRLAPDGRRPRRDAGRRSGRGRLHPGLSAVGSGPV